MKIICGLVLVIGLIGFCLYSIFSCLPIPQRVGEKFFIATYQPISVGSSKKAMPKKVILMSDGKGHFRFEDERTPDGFLIDDYKREKTYIINEKEKTYTSHALLKQVLADEKALYVPKTFLKLFFLGNENKHGYLCRHYICFCFMGYFENWYSPDLCCSTEFRQNFSFYSETPASLELVKYTCEAPPAALFELKNYHEVSK
jgi:hypothetical protein